MISLSKSVVFNDFALDPYFAYKILYKIEYPRIGFVDMWSYGQKVIKSSILGSVSLTSGAMARKS